MADAGKSDWKTTIGPAAERSWVTCSPRTTLTAEPDYEMYEYARHKGNDAVPNAPSGQRVLDAAASSTQEQ